MNTFLLPLVGVILQIIYDIFFNIGVAAWFQSLY